MIFQSGIFKDFICGQALRLIIKTEFRKNINLKINQAYSNSSYSSTIYFN
jgi:hypothetical protein